MEGVQGRREREREKNAGTTKTEDRKKRHSAVSYTHLDVYKRQ